MAIKSLDDILNSIKEQIGDEQTDEAIELLEDITDTFNEVTKNNNEDWKKKYEENDKAWRNKYKERFTSSSPNNEDDLGGEDDEPKPKTFDDLFKKEG